MIFHVQGRWIICDLSVARIPGKQIHINNEAEVFVFSQTFTCVHQGEGGSGGGGVLSDSAAQTSSLDQI